MDNVRQVQVRVTFINKLIEHLKRLHIEVNIDPKSERGKFLKISLNFKKIVIFQQFYSIWSDSFGKNVDTCLHDGGLEVVELEPLLMLPSDKLHGLVGVHLHVGSLHPLPNLILLVIITKCLLVLQIVLINFLIYHF